MLVILSPFHELAWPLQPRETLSIGVGWGLVGVSAVVYIYIVRGDSDSPRCCDIGLSFETSITLAGVRCIYCIHTQKDT